MEGIDRSGRINNICRVIVYVVLGLLVFAGSFYGEIKKKDSGRQTTESTREVSLTQRF